MKQIADVAMTPLAMSTFHVFGVEQQTRLHSYGSASAQKKTEVSSALLRCQCTVTVLVSSDQYQCSYLHFVCIFCIVFSNR